MVEPSRFEWRGALGSWRWVILGAIGAACGGRAGHESARSGDGSGQGGGESTSRVDPVAMGGSAMASPSPFPDPGGAAGLGGMAGGAGSSMPPKPSACEDEATQEGGVRRCNNGVLHRASNDRCAVTEQLPELVDEALFPPDAGEYACLHNADCTEKPFGQCSARFGPPVCSYGCASDDDCAAGQMCLCNSPAPGSCGLNYCRTDADCSAGHQCLSNTRCNITRFACTIAGDQCLVDSDCPGGSICALQPYSEINPLASETGQYRKCVPNGPCGTPGRPFLVAGEPCLAPLVPRCDWYSRAESERAPAQLPPELRAALAQSWTEQALMEHASIAAFARFTLQLLSLGAPADLVALSTQAMADELRHAQDCFRLARRYSQGELGPGPLVMAGALETTALRDIVLSTLREGCIGETVAAIEAAEALAHCADPEARPVLERIAAEETRHAELAWRFVAWALETAPEQRAGLCNRIRAELARELAAPIVHGEIGERDRELARYGLLSPTLRQVLRARVLREVVAPCAEALLASAPGGAAIRQNPLVDVDIERQRTAAPERPGVLARQLVTG